MKFLHTADWQIGMMAKGYGRAGERLRKQRLDSGERVVAAATSHGVDFMLVAGDLFEDNGVERTLIQRTVDILARFQGPVFILPGNHDPLVPGSVWEHPAWRSASNLFVLGAAQPVEIHGGFLYPCPVIEKYSRKDPTAWIQAVGEAQIHVGMAHGNMEGLPGGDPDLPIPRDAAKRRGLDYLALGHWHSTLTYSEADAKISTAYCGTPETSGFGERDSGNALIVEITAPGLPPAVRSLPTGALSWQIIRQEIRVPGDLSVLRQACEAIPKPEDALVDLYISGLLFADEQSELDHIQDILASRFLFARVNCMQLRPSPDDDRWIDVLPAGVLREAAARLRAMAADPGKDSQSGATASRALMELYALIGGASE
jgi:DNA repair exonuclease SbcCD nuclease subunit